MGLPKLIRKMKGVHYVLLSILLSFKIGLILISACYVSFAYALKWPYSSHLLLRITSIRANLTDRIGTCVYFQHLTARSQMQIGLLDNLVSKQILNSILMVLCFPMSTSNFTLLTNTNSFSNLWGFEKCYISFFDQSMFPFIKELSV